MSIRSNPVARVLAVFSRALQVPAGNGPLGGWAKVFSEGPVQVASSAGVLRCLALLHEEIDRAEAALVGARVRTEIIKPHLDMLRLAASVESAVSGWQHVSALIQQNNALGVLAVAAEMHPSDESMLTVEELEPIYAALATLVEAIRELPADDPVRWFLSEQYQELMRGLEAHRITGADALRRAVYQFDGAIRNQYSGIKMDDADSPLSAEQRQAIGASISVSSAIKTALCTLGFVAALGAGIEGADKIAAKAAVAHVYLLTGTTDTGE
jgi:hypothetical protein